MVLKTGCAVLAVLASAVALAAPVRAQAPESTLSFSCTLQGSATASVNWSANSNTYSFGPTGTGIDCIYARAASGFVSGGLAEAVVGSVGRFNNIVCGTGTLADNNPPVTSVTTTPDDPGTEQRLLGTDFGYNIVLISGEGTLTWDQDATEAAGGGVFNSPNSSAMGHPVGGGSVTVDPWRGPGHPLGNQGGIFPGSPPGPCTNGFNVMGVVGGTILGESAGTAQPPSNVSPPIVVGAPFAGQTLRTTDGQWDGTRPMQFAYLWYRCDAAGANCLDTSVTTAEYALTAADVGKTLRSEVTATNSFGSDSQRSGPSPVIQPAPADALDLDGSDPGPPAGEPSALCRIQGAFPLPPQHALGMIDFWGYVSTPPGKVNVCVRAEAGPQVAGGRLEIDTAGSPGVAPVVDLTQTDVSRAVCPQQIHESKGVDEVYTSPVGSNPVSVCVKVLGVTRRIDVGTRSTPTSPFVRWIPDTGSPGPGFQVP